MTYLLITNLIQTTERTMRRMQSINFQFKAFGQSEQK